MNGNITSPAGPVDRILLTGPWGELLLLHVTLTIKTIMIITINILMINNNFMIIINFGSLWLGPRESSYYSTSLWSRLAWSSWLPWWSIPSPSSSLWDPSDWALRESSYYSLSHSQLYCFPSCISSTQFKFIIVSQLGWFLNKLWFFSNTICQT